MLADWKYDFQKPMVKQWTDMTKLGELRRDEVGDVTDVIDSLAV